MARKISPVATVLLTAASSLLAASSPVLGFGGVLASVASAEADERTGSPGEAIPVSSETARADETSGEGGFLHTLAEYAEDWRSQQDAAARTLEELDAAQLGDDDEADAAGEHTPAPAPTPEPWHPEAPSSSEPSDAADAETPLEDADAAETGIELDEDVVEEAEPPYDREARERARRLEEMVRERQRRLEERRAAEAEMAEMERALEEARWLGRRAPGDDDGRPRGRQFDEDERHREAIVRDLLVGARALHTLGRPGDAEHLERIARAVVQGEDVGSRERSMHWEDRDLALHGHAEGDEHEHEHEHDAERFVNPDVVREIVEDALRDRDAELRELWMAMEEMERRTGRLAEEIERRIGFLAEDVERSVQEVEAQAEQRSRNLAEEAERRLEDLAEKLERLRRTVRERLEEI